MRRGLDPGPPPFERAALIALLNTHDAAHDWRAPPPPDATGPRAEWLRGRYIRRTIGEHNAGPPCLCGCGERTRRGERQFIRGHNNHTAAIRRRIDSGLLDPAVLSPDLRRRLARHREEPDPCPNPNPSDGSSPSPT